MIRQPRGTTREGLKKRLMVLSRIRTAHEQQEALGRDRQAAGQLGQGPRVRSRSKFIRDPAGNHHDPMTRKTVQ